MAEETGGLKPCPFCGSDDIDQMFESSDIECLQCMATMPSSPWLERAGVSDTAAAAWNRREAGWVPVKERLPRQGERVLISNGDEVLCGRWFDGHWREQGQAFSTDLSVTHWMPLPEPPEVGKR
jgi:Lar family restriction alleviation protein